MSSYLAESPLYQLLILIRQRFMAARVLQTAGALTYTTLLSLVPLVTVVVAVMRQFSPFMRLGENMRMFLLQNLLPERAGKVVATYALQFSEKASSLTILGTTFLVITALMLFSTIDRTIAGIWGVRRPRVWYVRIPFYWLALTLGPILFAGSVAVTGRVMAVSLGMIDDPGWVQGFLNRAMTALLLSALFAFLFHAIPNRRLNRWHGLAGGLVAGLGLVLMQRLFGFYLSKLPNFTLIYGTFSVVPIFLIWIYLSWFVVLLGATVAAVLPDFAGRHRVLPETPAGEMVAAVRLTRCLIEAQRHGRQARLPFLAEASRLTQLRTESMLEEMRIAGWAVRTEEGAWMLCVAAEAITIGDLVARLFVGIKDVEVRDPLIRPDDRQLLRAMVAHMRQSMTRPVTVLESPAVTES